MRLKLLSILAGLFFLPGIQWIQAQEKKVSGSVRDINGIPLIGVNILIKGSTTGTISNGSGEFAIQISAPSDVLVFSYVGYLTEEVPVGDKVRFDVLLAEDMKKLDEIVVIGYGSKKKSDIVGSVSTIKADELKAAPTSNLQSLLTGKVAGMYVSVGSARPGGSSNITIRGLNSLKGSTEPLYIVDNIPVTSVNEININDIESISTLKDASSQAIYGARASNGVILITTRKGSDTKGKVKVAYNTFMSIQNVKPNFELYSGEEYAQLRRDAYQGDLASAANGWIGETVADAEIFTPLEQENIASESYVNWLDKAFNKDVPLVKHDLSLSGGNENTRFLASLGYYDQQGVRYSSGLRRYSGKLQLDQRISNWIDAGFSTYYTNSLQDQENSSWRDFMVFSPVAKIYNSTGELELYPLGDQKSVNPLWWNKTRKLQNKLNRSIFNGYLEVTPSVLKGLKYRMNASYDQRNTENEDFRSIDDPSNYLGKGLAAVEISSTKNYLVENIMSYEKAVGPDHRLDVTLMQSAFKRNWLYTGSTATQLGNDFFGINSLNSAIESAVGRDETNRTMLSYMGRINYILMDRYLFNFTVRRDGSSVFGANNKWGNFPSVAFAWNMNKESFMRDINWINESKIRLSWGKIGNEAISPYGSMATANKVFYVSNGTTVTGYLPGTSLPNPNLKWETTSTVNLGYDFSLINGRISGEFDLYKRNTTDLLVDRTLPAGLGYTSMPDNLGEIENKGIEISMRGYPVSGRDFSWEIGGSLTINKNRLIRGVLQDSAGVYIDDVANNWFINEPVNVYYDYQFDGIWQIDDDIVSSAMPEARPGDVRVKDMDGDTAITSEDRGIIYRDPKWIGSFNTSFSYKGFRLSADVYIVQGVTRRSQFMSEYNYGGSLQGVLNGIKRDYWTPENPSNETFRPHFATLCDYRGSLDYKDASYIRLSNVTLTYSIPHSWLEKVGISSAQVYVRGDNLITITDYLSLGPETDPEDYPETVNCTFGFNINF